VKENFTCNSSPLAIQNLQGSMKYLFCDSRRTYTAPCL